MVRTLEFLVQGAWVCVLVGELRPHMPYMVWPKKKKKSPFYGNRGSERLSDSPVASQMAGGRAGIRT